MRLSRYRPPRLGLALRVVFGVVVLVGVAVYLRAEGTFYADAGGRTSDWVVGVSLVAVLGGQLDGALVWRAIGKRLGGRLRPATIGGRRRRAP